MACRHQQSGHVEPPPSQLGVIPQDRHHVGLILTFDLAENMALHPALRDECSGRFSFDWRHARERTRQLITQFDVRVPSRATAGAPDRAVAASLSGGNQQKIVIARALTFPHTAIAAADPTRGLDIGRHNLCARATAPRRRRGRRSTPDLDRPRRNYGALRPHRSTRTKAVCCPMKTCCRHPPDALPSGLSWAAIFRPDECEAAH